MGHLWPETLREPLFGRGLEAEPGAVGTFMGFAAMGKTLRVATRNRPPRQAEAPLS